MNGLADIDRLTGGKIGVFDKRCPNCSAFRHTSANRRAKVLRIYRIDENFAGFHCDHCGEKGFAHERNGARSIAKGWRPTRTEKAVPVCF
jgi:DNA-directed RNA polymerase subunit RPC12/RpoP